MSRNNNNNNRARGRASRQHRQDAYRERVNDAQLEEFRAYNRRIMFGEYIEEEESIWSSYEPVDLPQGIVLYPEVSEIPATNFELFVDAVSVISEVQEERATMRDVEFGNPDDLSVSVVHRVNVAQFEVCRKDKGLIHDTIFDYETEDDLRTLGVSEAMGEFLHNFGIQQMNDLGVQSSVIQSVEISHPSIPPLTQLTVNNYAQHSHNLHLWAWANVKRTVPLGNFVIHADYYRSQQFKDDLSMVRRFFLRSRRFTDHLQPTDPIPSLISVSGRKYGFFIYHSRILKLYTCHDPKRLAMLNAGFRPARLKSLFRLVP
jgi:hypothetical protein